jgi:MraZ protein
MKALIGNFETRVDAKRRVAIPVGIRDQIVDHDGLNFVVVPDPEPKAGRERYLWVFPDLYFRRLVASMKRSEMTPEDQEGLDQWGAISQVVKPDGQGRVVIPEKTIKYAVVAEEVMLSCSGHHIEIWPRDKWEEKYGSVPTLSRSIFDLATDNLAEE